MDSSAPVACKIPLPTSSFLDELATAAGADPLEFRLRHLKDARGAELLERLASGGDVGESDLRSRATMALGSRRAGVWPSSNTSSYRTYVGVVADVEIDRAIGEIRVRRFFVVQDCGQIINPDGVKKPDRGQHRADCEPNVDGSK